MPHSWGWATWRRVWNQYDVNMLDFDDFKNNNKIEKIWSKKNIQKYWIYIFQEAKNQKIMNTWDYQLCFLCFNKNLFNIIPNKNLVKNIGFGENATHTLKNNKYINNILLQKMQPLVKHPESISYSENNDYYSNKIALHNFRIKFFLRKIGFFKVVKYLIKIF